MTPPAEPPPPLPSPGESLTAQFCEWEKRGRGWQLWNETAYLEPPFRPFIHLYVPPADLDDGKRPTLASSLVTKVRGFWTRKPPEETLDPAVLALLTEPEIPPYEDDEGLVEFQVVLPLSAKVSNETFGSFLDALAFVSSPLAFEVIGTGKETLVQIVAREGDAEEVEQQLRGHFPEAMLRRSPKFLWELWLKDADLPTALVEFGLAEEFFRPLAALGTGADPLVALTGALATLREGEVGIFQVLFESVRHPWAESIFRAATNHEGRSFYENAPEMVGLAREKIASPLYAAVIRVAGRSEDEERAWQIARRLGAALSAMDRPRVNRLIPLENAGYDDIQHETDLVLRLSHRSGMILNSEELVSLVHLPTAAVRSPRMKRLAHRTKRGPAIATGHRTILGINTHEEESVAVSLSALQRLRHMHVLGAPGTGKSTFLENLVLQDIEEGHGVAVLDPHGDLTLHILQRVREERRGDVILFDPSDEEYPVGFNILSAHSEIEKNLLSSDLVSVFRRLSTSWGDQMTSVLGNAILAFLESESGGTLADLRRFLIEKEYREEFLKTVADPQVRYYWKKEFPMLTGGRSLGPLLTRLDTFLRPKLVRNVVAQRENKLDFRRIMDEGKIFLARLSQGAIGEENAWLLGSLLVAKFHQVALARQDLREEERKPFFMYADEFHNFVTPSMTQILSGTRKFGLGLTLAHHELHQLGGAGSEIGGAVLACPYTRVFFRLGDEDARRLEGGFSLFEAKDFLNLGTGEAIARVEQAEFDFNLLTAPLRDVDAQEGRASVAEIRRLSREKYGSPRAEVEAELAKLAAGEDEEEPREQTARKGKAERRKPPKAEPPPEAKAQARSGTAEPESEPAARAGTGGAAAETAYERDAPQPATGPEEGSAPASAQAETPRAETDEPPTITEAVPEVVRAARSVSSAESPPPLGRGGAGHKALQKKFATWARGMGWRAEIEWKLPDGSQAVDLHLEKAGVSVACEFPVTSALKDEIGNIRKCLAAGYAHLAVVSADGARLARIEEAARGEFSAAQLARVRFLSPGAFIAFMGEVEATLPASGPAVMGWQLKRRFSPPKDPGADSPAGEIRDIIGKRLADRKGRPLKGRDAGDPPERE